MKSETHLVHFIQFHMLQDLKGRKMDKFIPDRKNATMIAFDKLLIEKFSPNIRNENMASSHPLSLALKCGFEKIVLKFFC